MLLRLLAVALLGLICGSSHAADPVVIGFSFPSGLPRIAGVGNFDAVNKELEGVGRVVVINQDGDPLAALREGRTDLAVVPSGRLADTKATGLTVFGVPFLFNGVQDASALQRGAVGEAALASLATEGLVGLGYWNLGTQRIVGSQIASLDDLKGKKLRAMSSRQLQASLRQMGASPTSTAFGEVYAALQAGVVDATEASPGTTLAAKLYEVKPSLSEETLVVQVYVVVASQKSWNAFPYKVQSVLADQVNAIAKALASAIPELEQRTIGELKERGVKLVSFSAEDRKKAREVAYSETNLIADKQDTLVRVAVNAVRQESQQPVPRNQIAIDAAPRPTGTADLFYATDRKMEPTSDLNAQFGSQRGTLSYGKMHVNLGDGRAAAGASSGPGIEQLTPFANPQAFGAALTQAVQAATSKDLLVYIHGYNTSFRVAAETGALLQKDLKFNGVVLVFTWPSDGTAIQYPRDEQEQEVSRTSMEDLLKTVRTIPGLERIHVLAHSMGGRVITSTLEVMARDPAERPFLHHVILAAPDVYVARFNQTTDAMKRLSKRVTLYASAGDQALVCSQLLHDGSRAGQGGDVRIVNASIDTVDASNAESKSFAQLVAGYTPGALNMLYFLVFDSCRAGHSYITRNFSVLNDLHSLVTFDAPPEKRILLEKRPAQALWYWEMRQAAR
jgi:TRAP-type C4-dicarboxylate transport system substrate-binding protein/esterase/lipase superfamily enzyme